MEKGYIPKNCALWKKHNLEKGDVSMDNFDVLEIYIETSHLWRHLLKCKECGQLYFFEFYEEMNMTGAGNGNDYLHSTWIPIAPTEDAESLKDKSPLELLDPALVPRIQGDLTPDREVEELRWVGRPEIADGTEKS